MRHNYRNTLDQDELIRNLDYSVRATRYSFIGSNSTTDVQISPTESRGTSGITDPTEIFYRIAQEQELEIEEWDDERSGSKTSRSEPEFNASESVRIRIQRAGISQNQERLNSFRLLQPGWNGYDADSLDDVVISRAQDLLLEPKILSFTPEVFPTARDSIQFEYRRADGGYLEVEIYDDSFGMYLKAGGEEREEDDLTRDEIVSIIRAFHAK